MASIADVYITVLPETGKIADGIKKALLGIDDDVRKAAARWKREIESQLKDVTIEVKADTTKAEKQIERSAKSQKATVEVDADTAKAEAQIDVAARDRKATIEVDVDKNHLGSVVSGVEKALVGAAASVGPAIAGAVADAAPAVAQEAQKVGKSISESLMSGITSSGPGSIAMAIGIVELAALAADAVAITSNLVGVIGLIPAVATAAGAGMGTLMLATQGFMDALKNMDDPKKFAESLATLAPNAQQAALSIKSIMDTAIKPLEDSLSQNLFAGVGPQLINTINAILPAIQPGLEQIATAFNSVFMQVTSLLQQPEMVQLIQTMMSNIGSAFQIAGPAIAQFVEAFLKISSVGAGFLPGIAQGFADLATSFSSFITEAAANGSLQEFIDTALDGFSQLAPLLPQLVTAFMSLVPLGKELLPGFVLAMQGLIAMLPGLIGTLTTLGPNFVMIEGAVNGAKAAFDFMNNVITVAGMLWDGFKQKIQPVIDFFLTTIPAAVQVVVSAFQDKFPLISSVIGTVFGGIKSVVEPILTWLGNAVNFVIDKVNNAISAFNSLPLPDIPLIPGSNVKGGVNLSAPQPTPTGAPGQDASPTRSENRTSRPHVPPPAGPTPVAGAPAGGFPVPTPPPAGGGGGGGAGAGANAVPPGGLNWDALANAESGGNWAINTGNGYYGGLQFDQSTWDAYKGPGDPARADMASREAQIAAGERLYAKRGKAPWPKNGHLLTDQPGDAMRAPDNAYANNSGNGGGGGNGSGGSNGGVPRYPGDQAFLSNVPSGKYVQTQAADLSKGIGDCSSAVEDLINMMDGVSTAGRQMSTANADSWLTAHGFMKNTTGGNVPGAFNVGFNSHHMQATLPGGTNFNWGGADSAAAGGVGGSGAYGPGLTEHYYRMSNDYNGPGQSKEKPMYTADAKDTGGKQLGQDIVSGVAEIFGLGDVFPDPTQFGLFKIFKGIMGLQPGSDSTNSSSTDVGGGGGGGGNNLVDFVTSFIPGMNQQGGNRTDDHSFNPTFNGGNAAGNGDVMGALDNYYLTNQRRNTP